MADQMTESALQVPPRGAVVHCMKAPYDIYAGRGRDPHTNKPGRHGNPFSHRPSSVCGIIIVGTRGEAIERYRQWLWAQIREGGITREELAAMHGLSFGCWCAPRPCHAEVLAAAAEWAWRELHMPALPV